MSFDALLGNPRLKENIRRSISSGKPSHFYLLSGPKGSGKHTLARLLAAALLCTGNEKPCHTCQHCRKVLSGAHPDFITVNDPEHKTLPVQIVRQVRDEIFIRPNEGQKKIYMIDQEMRTEGQNALLKVLEEPPAYGVFMILTENPDAVLPTIRSRCTHLSLTALPAELLRRELNARFPQAGAEDISAACNRSGGYLGQAIALLDSGAADPQTEAFSAAYLSRSQKDLTVLLAPMEKWKRDRILPVLEQWLSLLQSALVCRCGSDTPWAAARAISKSRSSRELSLAVEALNKAILYTKSNVSVGAVCGYLVFALQ